MNVYLLVAAIVCNGCQFKVQGQFPTIAACESAASYLREGAWICVFRGEQNPSANRFRPAARR